MGSLLVAAVAALGRGLFGIGQGGRGWRGVSKNIQAPVVKTHPEWKQAWKGSRVQSYRRFGRTGWEVSDIVLGTGAIRDENGEKIARLAIDRGVNYFDTSPDYSGSGSEQAMGRAIRGVMATLQDLGFIIERANADLGLVTAARFAEPNYYDIIAVTVTVRPQPGGKMLIRANAIYNNEPVTEPEVYQNFFATLERSMFIERN